jgi:hypothetical protein
MNSAQNNRYSQLPLVVIYYNNVGYQLQYRNWHTDSAQALCILHKVKDSLKNQTLVTLKVLEKQQHVH